MLQIDARVWILWAVWLLLLPLEWLFSGLLAAGFHELFHCMALYLLGGRLRGVRIGCFGAVMETEGIFGWREAVCALAGPAGSLSLLCFLRSAPMLALCGLIQGAFNLLPIYPLDGGRVMRWGWKTLVSSCGRGKKP